MIDKPLSELFSNQLGVEVVLANCNALDLDHMDFDQKDIQYLQKLPEFKRSEWISSRKALSVLVDKSEKKLLSTYKFPHPKLSLTHSEKESWAIKSIDPCVLGIGIDFEKRKSGPNGCQRFFLTDKEQKEFIEQNLEECEIIDLWTKKEAVFKSDINNSNLGLKNFELQNLKGSIGIARSLNDDTKKFKYFSTKIKSGTLSVSVCFKKGLK